MCSQGVPQVRTSWSSAFYGGGCCSKGLYRNTRPNAVDSGPSALIRGRIMDIASFAPYEAR